MIRKNILCLYALIISILLIGSPTWARSGMGGLSSAVDGNAAGSFVTEMNTLTLPDSEYLAGEITLNILPEALIGCRSPEEPGCGACCYSDGGQCIAMRWTSDGRGDIEPWYNQLEVLKEWPHHCLRCAQCSKRSEQQLYRLLSDGMICDCAGLEIGIDPCFYAASCECWCSRVEILSRECPFTH